MPKTVSKAADNIYCKARLQAAKYNDAFKSREGASEHLGISKDALTKYELDLCKVIPCDVVVIMADAYNAPELLNHYCANECPIGNNNHVKELELKPIESVTLQMISILKRTEEAKVTLIDIAADGVITEDEVPKLNQVIECFDRLINSASELKLWAEKYVR